METIEKNVRGLLTCVEDVNVRDEWRDRTRMAE